MPSTERKLQLKARHRWLRPSHRRLCINRPSKLSRLTGGCVGQRVNDQLYEKCTNSHWHTWIHSYIQCHLVSIITWSIWLWVFPWGDIQVYLRMFWCWNILLLTTRFVRQLITLQDFPEGDFYLKVLFVYSWFYYLIYYIPLFPIHFSLKSTPVNKFCI
jgi:hypothetical protein